jgi:hypothetical protein
MFKTNKNGNGPSSTATDAGGWAKLIAAPVIIALVAGGSAPWWFDQLKTYLWPPQPIPPATETSVCTKYVPPQFPDTRLTKIVSFTLNGNGEGFKPGIRKWARETSEVWKQAYPDGSKQLNRVVARAKIGACDGEVIESLGTNEGDFQSFIPNNTCDEKMFLFRRPSQGCEWHPYRSMENVTQ